MPSSDPSRPTSIALHLHAAEDLRYIRRAMEESTRFTAVSGVGQIGVGVLALAAAWLSARSDDPGRWLAIWLATAGLAFVISVAAAVWKARRIAAPVLSLPGRRFLFALAPALVAGALLTPPLYRAASVAYLPALWLLLFGAGVIAAGVHSIPTVPVVGAAFMAAGVVALIAPRGAEDLVMGIGFGGLHLVFGAWIAWRHGG